MLVWADICIRIMPMHAAEVVVFDCHGAPFHCLEATGWFARHDYPCLIFETRAGLLIVAAAFDCFRGADHVESIGC